MKLGYQPVQDVCQRVVPVPLGYFLRSLSVGAFDIRPRTGLEQDLGHVRFAEQGGQVKRGPTVALSLGIQIGAAFDQDVDKLKLVFRI